MHYDPETGVFKWKVRSDAKADWNTRWSGKRAGSLFKNGYFYIGINHKDYLAHRLAWFYIHKEWPTVNVDHIDRNPQNNKIGNLRKATQSENLCNKPKRNDNTSGFKGVCLCQTTKRWMARISINQKKIWLGRFDTAELAFEAYKIAALKHHGEFANF